MVQTISVQINVIKIRHVVHRYDKSTSPIPFKVRSNRSFCIITNVTIFSLLYHYCLVHYEMSQMLACQCQTVTKLSSKSSTSVLSEQKHLGNALIFDC